MTRSSTGTLKLLTTAGLLSADCDMCITGAEVEGIKFFVSLDAPFFACALATVKPSSAKRYFRICSAFW